MRIAVIDSVFRFGTGKTIAHLWLEHVAGKAGVPVVDTAHADVILVTMLDPEEYQLIRQVRRKNKSAMIVVGGPAATAPHALLSGGADVVCVGDGQRFLKELFHNGIDAASALDNALTKDACRAAIVDPGFPWGAPFIEHSDGQLRVWCGRGCKMRCAFCQTGWAEPYAEHPNPGELLHRVHGLQREGKKFCYLSNDVMQHTFAHRLPQVDSGSYTFAFMRKFGLPPGRQVRIGVEGVSARLRALVGKPIAHDDLWRSAVWLVSNKKSVRWFMISGFPTECEDDWLELRDAAKNFVRYTTKGVLQISFTAWVPQPATPMSRMPVSDSYYDHYTEFKTWFFSGGGWSNRVMLYDPQKPSARNKRASAKMGIDSASLYKIRTIDGPNSVLVKYPYSGQCVRRMGALMRDAFPDLEIARAE